MNFRGEQTEKVTLKQRTQTGTNDINEPEYDWDQNDEDYYLEFMDRHSTEGDEGGQVLVMQEVEGFGRYKAKLDPNINSNKPEADFRIVRGTTTYDIESILPRGRGKKLKFIFKRRE